MVRINLLPIRSILRKRELRQFYQRAGGIVAVAFVVMGLVYLYYDSAISSLDSEVASKKQRLAKLQEGNKEIKDLQIKVESLEQQVKSVRNLTKTRISPAPFMQGLALAIPGDVWLDSITFTQPIPTPSGVGSAAGDLKTPGAFTLSGTGTDNTVVVDFIQRLQNLKKKQVNLSTPKAEQDKPFFGNVKLGPVTRTAGPSGQDQIQFTVGGVVN